MKAFLSLSFFSFSFSLGTAAENAPQPIAALVAEITTQNPELRFYEAEIAFAQAAGRTALARPDPELSLDAGHKRVRSAAGDLAGEGLAWSVSLTQTFEWPGRLALRKSLANRQVELAELGLARFRSALVAQAQTLAYGLYSAQAKSLAVREVADRFSDLKATFLARDPAGITPQLETRVIEAAELTLQRRANAADLALQSALLELNQLRGVAIDAPLTIPAFPLKFGNAPARDTLLAAAHENNFDFKIRLSELEQQLSATLLARHERLPSVSVSPFYSQEKAGDRETTAGVGVSFPLPLGGRTRGNIESSNARERQAEAAVAVAQRQLDRDVLTTAHAFATKVAETQRWSADTLQQFRDSAALADRHYRLGAVPIATYVELQSSYLDAVEALLDTEQEALAAGLKLQQLTGLNFNAVEVAP